jgi:hypothetical protein
MEKRPIVGLVEEVTIATATASKTVKARIDTGATKSSIDMKLAEQLQLGPVLERRTVRSAHGSTVRSIVKARLTIDGIELEDEFNIAERGHMTYPVLIGQNILKKGKFMVDPLT